MQRKNGLLGFISCSRRTSGSILTSGKLSFTKKVPSRQSRGFALITAIIVMLVVSSIISFTLMQTAQSVKKTADIYLYEQAELHTKSIIEYALFVIARDGCTNNLNFTLDTIYDVNVDMRYIYTGLTTNVAGTNCAEYIGAASPTGYIVTDEQDGSVLMDISIAVTPAFTGSDTIRYFRRTIQKL